MNGPELLALCKDVLSTGGEAEAEVWIRSRTRGCARFSIGELSQHMALEEGQARVRVAKGKRVAEVSTSELERGALEQCLREAAALAANAPEEEGFEGFGRGEGALPAVDRFAAATAEATDALRAERVGKVLERVRAEGMTSAGMLETSVHSVAVATTRGCARAHDGTMAGFRVWALDDAAGRGASGHGSHMTRDVRDLRVDEETEDAIKAAKDGRNPGSVDAGTWDVVMEPEAVAELLEWLGSIAFGAPEVEQGTSALAGKMGEKLTGEQISITEDVTSSDAYSFADPFDRDGTARQDVRLIDAGVARGVLYDRVYAARAKKASTGSAVVPDFGAPGGVGAVALRIAPGDAKDAADLVAGMKRGLYVRRLHYVNGFVDTLRAVMTGLSRDGCFLVEGGKIVRAVGNVRFTDSFLDMLARSDGRTRGLDAIPSQWVDGGTLAVPAIRFRGVTFTSGSAR